MGQKDYTDWNGPRRKSIQKPPRERMTQQRARTPKKHKIPGIKCTADRYKALKLKVAYYEERVKQYQNQDTCFSRWSKSFLKDYSQKLRHMECQLRRRDLWRKIQEYL